MVKIYKNGRKIACYIDTYQNKYCVVYGKPSDINLFMSEQDTIEKAEAEAKRFITSLKNINLNGRF